jgi:mono/diheme cytochrome c family protein
MQRNFWWSITIVVWGAFFLGVLLLHVGNAQEGKSLFTEKCQICHGASGKGDGPAAASLSPSPPDFTSSSFWEKINDAKITATIENGHGQMPPFSLSSSEIKAIIKYLKDSFRP